MLPYVLDENDELASRINPGLVEIETVSDAQASELQSILEKHAQVTQSPKAIRILNHWDESLPLFKTVIPTEYKRIIEGR